MSFLVVQLYLIEILHQTTTTRTASSRPLRCILSKFYIKPQPEEMTKHTNTGCILSKFYIKPQQCNCTKCRCKCCILSKFYIKPQLFYGFIVRVRVVSYRNSTSNHNPAPDAWPQRAVVSYRNSTSNHNLLGEFVNR